MYVCIYVPGPRDESPTLLIFLKTGMQVIHGLLEAIGRHLVPLVVDEPYLDAPAAHGEALHGRGLADGALPRDQLDGALDLWVWFVSGVLVWSIVLWFWGGWVGVSAWIEVVDGWGRGGT